MMPKKVTSIRLDDEILDYLEQVQEITHLSRSKTAELLFTIVQDYFSLDQVSLESSVRDTIDGRTKKSQGIN